MASPTTPGLALGFRYGLYPFAAENDDEISFVPGERIEILEQDDQYGDGWWQVRPFLFLALRLSARALASLDAWARRGRRRREVGCGRRGWLGRGAGVG